MFLVANTVRYHYTTVHQCDACGLVESVPQPCDLRTLTSDPRPPGWGLPTGTGILRYDITNKVHINDICGQCMQLPLETIIAMATNRAEIFNAETS